jgi:hypothetical protein
MCVAVMLTGIVSRDLAAAELRVGTFAVDASPPVGSPLAYNPCTAVAMPLQAKGIVIVGSGDPIVLCAVDWIGIANDGQTRWRSAIAQAAATSVERVSVHTLHQHDAPQCDYSAEALLADQGLSGTLFDVEFVAQTIDRVATAVGIAAREAKSVTHIGVGSAEVKQVASNRRILGEDGRVRGVRYTACKDPELRAAPEGVIDPILRSISFWQDNVPVAVLTYYATHPQSYYLTGIANPDFPGMARELRQATHNGLPHIHFNGAGGNIGAGKYNDGAPDNRQRLTERLATGMLEAWQATERVPIAEDDVRWRVAKVSLPVAPHLDEEQLSATIENAQGDLGARQEAAHNLAWLRRCQAGDQLDVSCLTLGNVKILHIPGEAVVEYQLFAQRQKQNQTVCVAAYADYAPGYICLERHYAEGGYESSPRASRVASNVEQPLSAAISEALRDDD